MTTTVEDLRRSDLIREIERLRAENEALRAQVIRPLPKSAEVYLRVLNKFYGLEAWTTPQCLHLVAAEVDANYDGKNASGSAIRTLMERGLIERQGGALRLTSAGTDSEQQPAIHSVS